MKQEKKIIFLLFSFLTILVVSVFIKKIIRLHFSDETSVYADIESVNINDDEADSEDDNAAPDGNDPLLPTTQESNISSQSFVCDDDTIIFTITVNTLGNTQPLYILHHRLKIDC